jgi:hypothetical protein
LIDDTIFLEDQIEKNEDKSNSFGCGFTAAVIYRHSHATTIPALRKLIYPLIN